MRNGLHYNTTIPLYVEGCSTLNKIYFIENLTPTIVSYRVRSFGMILFQSGFIGSFDLPWSEWSQITDPDHPKETHPYAVFTFKRLLRFKLTEVKLTEPK